jgi:hypothetical protein
MRRKIGINRIILTKLITIALVSIYFVANKTANTHVHFTELGLISHSHPLAPKENKDSAPHSHGSDDFALIAANENTLAADTPFVFSKIPGFYAASLALFAAKELTRNKPEAEARPPPAQNYATRA